MAFVKPIREKGIVISKTHKEAKEERTDNNGKVWPARDEEYVVEVVSCDEDDFNENTGILNGTRAEYKVDEATFKKVKFGDWANVKFTASQYGEKLTIKPESFALIASK
jgi:hypothetical protein